MPMRSEELLRKVDELYLALLETALYLDTHSDDCEALTYFLHMNALYEEAKEAYNKEAGPLQLEDITSIQDGWNWIRNPWPWERGEC